MQEGQDSAPQKVDASTLAIKGKTQTLNLDYGLASLLCYVPFAAISLIFSVIFLKTEPKDNQFVRFNAAQSLVLSAALLVTAIVCSAVSGVLGAIPLMGWLFLILNSLVIGLLSLGYVLINLFGMYKSYQGKAFRIKYAADFADNLLTRL
jgi:uncharacterized membrane protein